MRIFHKKPNYLLLYMVIKLDFKICFYSGRVVEVKIILEENGRKLFILRPIVIM